MAFFTVKVSGTVNLETDMKTEITPLLANLAAIQKTFVDLYKAIYAQNVIPVTDKLLLRKDIDILFAYIKLIDQSMSTLLKYSADTTGNFFKITSNLTAIGTTFSMFVSTSMPEASAATLDTGEL